MQKQILLLEDHPSLRRLFRDILAYGGCEVTETSSCDVALEYVRNNYYDFIMADVELIGENSLEFIQTCCKWNLTVVVVSSNDDYLVQCRDMGVLAFIRKPISANNLLDLVNNINTAEIPNMYLATRHGHHRNNPNANASQH